MKDEEIKNKAKETSGGNYYYEQGFIYGFELGEENGRKELEKENAELKANQCCNVSDKELCLADDRLQIVMKENEELKSLKDVADLIRLNNSHIVAMAQLNNNNVALSKENEELKKQNEKLKCCGNCFKWNTDKRCESKIGAEVCDNWEQTE